MIVEEVATFCGGIDAVELEGCDKVVLVFTKITQLPSFRLASLQDNLSVKIRP